MLIDNLNTLVKTILRYRENNEARRKIDLIIFLDIEQDTEGWFALGHHDPEEFIKAISERVYFTSVSADQVQLTWAKYDGHNFTVFDKSGSGIQAITFVETFCP
jgi:hypothetical protein